MRPGKMYRIKNLKTNRLNTVMRITPTGDWSNSIPRLETENPRYLKGLVDRAGKMKLYNDGDLVACLGVTMYDTHHYEKQPFYKVLTLTGDIAYVSKGTRNKYFELVKQK